MPADQNSSITYLDVQFGAMDLMDASFDSNSVAEVKYGTDNNRRLVSFNFDVFFYNIIIFLLALLVWRTLGRRRRVGWN